MTHPVDPQERKKEFMETALKLFNEKGYEKTTINDIIKAMGVSKGAFYHYFASKEDVIEQISDNYAQRVLGMTSQLADRKDMKAVEKINQLFQTIQGYKRSSSQKRSQIKQIFQDEQNLKLERKILNKLRKQMAVSLEKMIQQGVENKEFRQVNPREMTEFLQYTIQGLNGSCENLYYEYMTQESPDHETFRRLLEEKLQFYEEILAQIFQVPPGTIQLKDAYLNRYLER
ncbi:MAG: TetR/AcrR family transcriptional regulator [Tindallia sp. MSAO_Bac2]|nr:MAG: TetR/AcrR family transcriptional regulator [Tindallia sp. MSAO_Bac2]